MGERGDRKWDRFSGWPENCAPRPLKTRAAVFGWAIWSDKDDVNDGEIHCCLPPQTPEVSVGRSERSQSDQCADSIYSTEFRVDLAEHNPNRD